MLTRFVSLCLACLCFSSISWADEPPAWTFEKDKSGEAPEGWLVPEAVANAGWTAITSDDRPAGGERCLQLKRLQIEDHTTPFGNVMTTLDATAYRGKRVTFSAAVRIGNVGTRAQLWLRVDRAGTKQGAFDNMGDRPILTPEWSVHEISARVDDDAQTLNIGLMAIGGDGPVFLDNVKLSFTDALPKRFSPGKELSDRGLVNLEALTRLIGYVRHYHPSDEAVNLDWDSFAIEAAIAAEPAQGGDELATALSGVFRPIAPSVQIQSKPFDKPFDPEALRPKQGESPEYTWWQHIGYGGPSGKAGMIYRSARMTGGPLARPPANAPKPGTVIEKELPGGIFIRVPMVVYKDEKGTFPKGSVPELAAAKTEPTGEDRATRLAGVMLFWNIAQHFYPYFDVSKSDWNAALPRALKRAAEDTESDVFVETLLELVTELHDGHGNVMVKSPPHSYVLPIQTAFVGEELVITVSGPGAEIKCVAGERIDGIAGQFREELVAQAQKYEPAATLQHFQHRTIDRLMRRPTRDPVPMSLREVNGQPHTAALVPIERHILPPAERRPEPIAELKPGVVYIDVERVGEAELKASMEKIEAATGLVIDVRGYPSRFPWPFLGRLTDTALRSPQWHVPVCNFPDGENRTWQQSGWPILPQKPRLKAKVAFIIDGRAISAAETFMGIVDFHKLGEIVGEPTAGTNGNVNTVALPGGFTVMFTGMKVLRQDGSLFYGQGIQPTIPVTRTLAGIAAGKDEFLEKAIEVVSGPPAQAAEPVSTDKQK